MTRTERLEEDEEAAKVWKNLSGDPYKVAHYLIERCGDFIYDSEREHLIGAFLARAAKDTTHIEIAAPTDIQHSLVLEFRRILSEDEWRTAVNIAKTVPGVQALRAEAERRDGPLLQCIDCRNTESPAGAMARQFNHGRCLHCGGFFKVVRA